MPIIDVKSNIAGTAAEWDYTPDEDLDLSRFSNITCLYISAYPPRMFTRDDDDAPAQPYMLPSIAARFPNLTHLRIRNWVSGGCFIGGITDIPETVVDVHLDGTSITDLTPVFRPRLHSDICLTTFSLVNNVTPITRSGPLPHGLLECYMEGVFFEDPIIFPTTVHTVTCIRCRIPIILGLDHASPILNVIIENCITPYDKGLLRASEHLPNTTLMKVNHITYVNAQNIYLELGSIPIRIKLSKGNIDSNIVTAMFLKSNYPRRMAEFVANTTSTTQFGALPEPPIPEFNWDDDEMEEEDDYEVYYGAGGAEYDGNDEY